MSDLKKYVKERKQKDSSFADGYEKGYDQFRIGVMLKRARETAGMTQD